MPVDHFSAIGVTLLKEKFALTSIPNVSGPHNVSFQAQVFFQGVPKFPVQRKTKIVSCASGWTCSDYNGTYNTSSASPLTFNYKCNTSGSTPTSTNAIQHTSTCTATTVAGAAKAVGEGGAPSITIEP